MLLSPLGVLLVSLTSKTHGNIKQAGKFFASALQEAKKGFGERDAHVASACNNLWNPCIGRLAVNILEEYFGINDISLKRKHTLEIKLMKYGWSGLNASSMKFSQLRGKISNCIKI
ncbi:hypothetical protein ACS0TY_007129 [Phlomoides rotata]